MRWVTRLTVALTVTAGLAVGANGQPSGESTDAKALQGTWQAVKLEAEGMTGPKEVTAKVRWIFKGDEYTGVSPEKDFKGKYTVNAAREPREIDLIPTGGKKAIPGIYKRDGDQLLLCVGQTRPTGFVTRQGSDWRLFVLKRVKD